MKTVSLLILVSLISLDNFAQDMIFIKGNKGIPSFYIDKYEVSLLEFENFCNQTGYVTTTSLGDSLPWKYDVEDREIPLEDYASTPVTKISVADMQAYAKWLGKRLPLASEWIYAVKSKSTSPSYWYRENSNNSIQKVDSNLMKVNNVYNMLGNASEVVINDHHRQFARNWSHDYVAIGGNCNGPKYLCKKKHISKFPDSFICQDDKNVEGNWFRGFRCVVSAGERIQTEF